MANTVRMPTHATAVIFSPTAITVSRRYLVSASKVVPLDDRPDGAGRHDLACGRPLTRLASVLPADACCKGSRTLPDAAHRRLPIAERSRRRREATVPLAARRKKYIISALI